MVVRILIVDDEKALVRTLRQILRIDLPQVDVDAAYSGEEALSRLASSTYDLIIADLYMPGVDGLELIKGVRYLDSEVPILLMTAYGSAEVQEKAVRLGVCHYLDKPFDADDILEAVRACLEGQRETRA